MFPSTVWATIEEAGAAGPGGAAFEGIAERYRPAIAEFLRRRGYAESDADDLCQEVFLRLLTGRVLASADPTRGRFRSLLLAVTRHVILDWHRRRKGVVGRPIEAVEELPAPEADPEFDRSWVLALAERALVELEAEESPYYAVLRDHLLGLPQDRNRLWIARRKLVARIRRQVAFACRSHAEFEEEVAYLSPYLRPGAGGTRKD